MPLSNKWLTPERTMQLCDTDVYRSLGRLMLIETCSYDIKDEHIVALKEKLNDN
jgi:hypothetical protein